MRCRVASSEAMRTGEPAVRVLVEGILLSPACLPGEHGAWDKHSPWVPWAGSASSVEDYNTWVEREEKNWVGDENREQGMWRGKKGKHREMVGSSWRWLRLPGRISHHAPIPSFACSLAHLFTRSHLNPAADGYLWCTEIHTALSIKPNKIFMKGGSEWVSEKH